MFKVYLKYKLSLMKRQVIYAKDIQIITGKSERYGRILIQKMKTHFNKEYHQVISIEEFCQYMGLKYESVIDLIY